MLSPFEDIIAKFLTPLGFVKLYMAPRNILCAEGWMIEIVNNQVIIYPIDENPKFEITYIDLNDPQSLDKLLQVINE